MTDEEKLDLQQAANVAAAREVQQSPRRSLLGLVGIVLLVVVVALALLMLRSCGADEDADEAATKTIVPVEKLAPMPGVVSVWVEADADVREAVRTAGVAGEDFLDMGQGRYVVQVRAGSEDASVGRLKRAARVYDAGRVYQEPEAQ